MWDQSVNAAWVNNRGLFENRTKKINTRWAKCRVLKIYSSWYIQLPLGCSVHKGARVKMEAAGFCKILVLITELHGVKSQNRVMLLVLLTHSHFSYKCILSTLSFVFCFLRRNDVAHLKWFCVVACWCHRRSAVCNPIVWSEGADSCCLGKSGRFNLVVIVWATGKLRNVRID